MEQGNLTLRLILYIDIESFILCNYRLFSIIIALLLRLWLVRLFSLFSFLPACYNCSLDPSDTYNGEGGYSLRGGFSLIPLMIFEFFLLKSHNY
jgi:hypothetical protein